MKGVGCTLYIEAGHKYGLKSEGIFILVPSSKNEQNQNPALYEVL